MIVIVLKRGARNASGPCEEVTLRCSAMEERPALNSQAASPNPLLKIRQP
jgi:hypothetical protein